MIKKLTAALFLFLIGIGIVTAQMRITGQIVDEKGEPIAGATIQIKNNKKLGTSSDISGNFVISVPKNSILIISYIGYKTQEVKAVPKKKRNIETQTGSTYFFTTPFHKTMQSVCLRERIRLRIIHL